MLLSSVSDSTIRLGRDGTFQNLGFLIDRRPSMLCFLENEKFLAGFLRNDCVSAVLTTEDLAARIPESIALGVSKSPRLAFAALHNRLALGAFYWTDFPTFIDPQADVHPRAWIAERNVSIGPHTKVGPNATVLERCVIEANVTIGAGAVLGGVGFQTVRSSGSTLEMSHAGGLAVRERSHVLHGAVIATGLFRNNTEIGCEARIGAQSFLSHGVRIGERAFVGHGAVLNGNVVVGDDAWIGPRAVVAQHLEIGPRSFVSLGSVVVRNVGEEQKVSGNFAISHRRLLRHLATIDAEGKAE